jgi:hypothetical protein
MSVGGLENYKLRDLRVGLALFFFNFKRGREKKWRGCSATQ